MKASFLKPIFTFFVLTLLISVAALYEHFLEKYFVLNNSDYYSGYQNAILIINEVNTEHLPIDLQSSANENKSIIGSLTTLLKTEIVDEHKALISQMLNDKIYSIDDHKKVSQMINSYFWRINQHWIDNKMVAPNTKRVIVANNNPQDLLDLAVEIERDYCYKSINEYRDCKNVH